MTAKGSNRQGYAILIIGILFFAFGFITWLNSTLIPFLKLVCELKTTTQAFFVTSAFYMAYFFLALPSARILRVTGYKKGMALGLAVMAVGSILFIPAANDRSFPLFLTGLFIQASGLALLQTASNPYISILGPIESAAQRISIMGICNKAAGILSPIILGAIVLKNAEGIENNIKTTTDAATKEQLLAELAQRIVTPYIVIAIALTALAIWIYFSALPEINEPEEVKTNNATAEKSIGQFPHLWLGVLCLFFYVGVEVLAGDAIGPFGTSLGMSLKITKNFTSMTLGAMLIGYIIGVFTIPKYLSQHAALKYSAILGVLLSLGILFSGGYTAIALIILMGLANALMWPAIFPLAIDGLGRFTAIASAFLVMAIVGGAIIPPLYGYLHEKAGLSTQAAFFACSFPAYLYILYYSISGYKAGKA
ncbi:MAG TPA: sugar MFS transporter [Flavihumibacter sp.]|nr:sugar MFS transporter [Bacteroidota bacterium]HOA37405.1 sugar MFS transporter [Flavihumibacter sp.]HPZ87292.1 sugar MFS transporter [Flavihumibacter sp.]HQD08983.1 sugar MFS transporter [Flavihumibacter sp.]